MDLQTPTWLPTAGWLHDGDISRELVAAVVAVVVFLLTAPAGRRRLAAAAIVILLFAPVPLALPLLFPEEATAGWIAELAVRFLVLASLLQSLLLVAAVSVWERIGRPLEKIFLDVFRWLAAAVALLVILLEAGVDPAGVFAGSALISAAIGFASKDTLGNLFAGLAIHAEHPFEVGDWIQYDADPAHVGEVVEVDLDRLDEFREVLEAGPDVVLLDNMPPPLLREAVALRDRLAPSVILEASGGIRPGSIAAVAAAGVERISTGWPTHASAWLDLGLDWATGPGGGNSG